MKAIEPGRIAERGHALSQRISQEFGGLTAPQSTGTKSVLELTRANFLATLRGGKLASIPKEITLYKPYDPQNLAQLTSPAAIGRTFGIMSPKKIVYGGIITERTKPGELHFTRLSEGGGIELANLSGIDNLGRIAIEVGGLIQHPDAGTKKADLTSAPASEIGHALQALSALTDSTVLESLTSGDDHLAHGWAENQGIAHALTNRSSGVSAFTAKTENGGEVRNGFAPEIVITQDTSDYILVDHSAITDRRESAGLGVSSAELAVGMGMLAAESQLEQKGVLFEDQVMRVMNTI